MPSVIAFCHLRWDFVYQRPQHILSRLARNHRVLVIEEPVFDRSGPGANIFEPAPNVRVVRPRSPIEAPGFHDDHLPMLKELVRRMSGEYPEAIAWFYTPMALPLLDEIDARQVVYDCMDELSAFRHAPRQLGQRESALFKFADVVFTGGPSLYRAKADRHPSVHCFPSSVDSAHFNKAADPSFPEAVEQQGLVRPRLGFFGVLDERLDAELFRQVAACRPQWQFVMVGPTVKIDPATLPSSANVTYTGLQRYERLPEFMAGWDVCLMPFARNESTEYISPTKVLEYMAAEKPIVSTRIRDVAEPYGDVVELADSVDDFVAACERALDESPERRAERVRRMREIISGTSWDHTVARMEAVLATAPQRSERARALAGGRSERRVKPAAANHPVVIIGAGPTGLAAAYTLQEQSLLVERNDRVGGWCRSVQDAGFTFDCAGHIMFSTEPYVLDLYQTLLGDNVHWQDREAWIYSKEVYTRYPFQGALYGLPPKVTAECITGAIEARFGSLDASKPLPKGDAPVDFESFIYQVWGRGIAEHFAIPYNRKLWTVPLSEMETSWLGGRVPLPDLGQIIRGALEPVPKPMGPNARFGYPLKGGFQALMDGFLPHLKGPVLMRTEVTDVALAARRVRFSDGTEADYEHLISTMPLPKLVQLLAGQAPSEVHEAAAKLRHVSVRCVNIGVGRENLTDKHWIYYPESTVFHRIFVQGNASPFCNPKGGFGLTCEITYSPHKPLPATGQELIERCIAEARGVGLIGADDPILCANEVDMPYAYVVYDHDRAAAVQVIRSWLRTHDVHLAGRYSEWEYYNSDHAFVAGRRVALEVAAQLATQPADRRAGAI